MPHSEAVNWQPISEMPLIASMIDEALDDTRAHIKTLTEASARPHVMDDATVDRIDRVHAEQVEFVDIYAEQIGLWRNERPSVRQTRELDRWRSKTDSCATRPQPFSPCPASCARGLSSASWKRAISNLALRRFFGDDPLPAVSHDPRPTTHDILCILFRWISPVAGLVGGAPEALTYKMRLPRPLLSPAAWRGRRNGS